MGGGFTGTLLAINLARHGGPRATLIERLPREGRGVAYSTLHPEHVLNVRAGNMSALPDQPGHFAAWLERRGIDAVGGFASRRDYGVYLHEMLADARAAAGDRLRVVQAEAVDVELGGEAGSLVRLATGQAIAADTVALAPGNLPPLVPGGLDADALAPGCFVADPWRGRLADGLYDGDAVLVLGTGLTMVDVALLLDAAGFRGRIVAVSRRGLAPRAHGEVAPTTLSERPAPTPLALSRAVRARGHAVGWRAAVDELRPFTQGLWRAMAVADRARFLRHLRPWWDVHRHRIAPHVAERLDAMRAEGRLEIVAGRVRALEPDGAGAAVKLCRRGTDGIETLTAARVVNGTGPQGDLTRSGEPLLRALVRRGLLQPDPLRIGVDVDQDSRAVGADGTASDALLVLGPMTRGAFWEIVAVPDIRRQVWSVARRLSNAQWVEGEGL